MFPPFGKFYKTVDSFISSLRHFADRPYAGVNIVDVRLNLGLGSHGHYLNEHLLTGSNDDRSDSLNPNNDARRHALNNHADQLNPNNKRFAP